MPTKKTEKKPVKKSPVRSKPQKTAEVSELKKEIEDLRAELFAKAEDKPAKEEPKDEEEKISSDTEASENEEKPETQDDKEEALAVEEKTEEPEDTEKESSAKDPEEKDEAKDEVDEEKDEVADASVPEPQDPNDIVKIKTSRNFLKPLLIFLILGGLLGGGFYLYQNRESLPFMSGVSSLGTQPTPTSAPTPVEPTPSPTPDVSKYEVKILNGSGTAGEAGAVQDILEDANFTVSDTGNAESYDYKETVIQAKEDVDKKFLQTLRTELSDAYAVAEDVETLEEAETDDVIVIVGSTKAE